LSFSVFVFVFFLVVLKIFIVEQAPGLRYLFVGSTVVRDNSFELSGARELHGDIYLADIRFDSFSFLRQLCEVLSKCVDTEMKRIQTSCAPFSDDLSLKPQRSCGLDNFKTFVF
jgi:hypothetical protein